MNGDPQNPQETELSARQLSEQEGIRRDKLQRLMESGKNPFSITHFSVSHSSTDVLSAFDSLEGKTVSIAGRMVSRRIMGELQ